VFLGIYLLMPFDFSDDAAQNSIIFGMSFAFLDIFKTLCIGF